MPKSPLTSIIRRDDKKLVTFDQVTKAVAAPGQCWLAVSPHDDDVAIGMGMLAMAAVAEGVDLHVAIVSDGSMGYSKPQDQASIVQVRRRETEASMKILGVKPQNIHWLGFPDCDLPSHQGRKPKGTGITHAMTGVIRKTKCNAVFCPTGADLHPDHRIVASETAIACFHASGAIWLELGEPVPVPARWDYAVYCNFTEAPNLEIRSDEALLKRKLDSIACYVSQPQISGLVEHMRQSGPVECFLRCDWQPYSAKSYAHLFGHGQAKA
jgi:LmbE family N-acetylglucosaminyl deacetylase